MPESVYARAVRVYRMRRHMRRYYTHHPQQRGAHILANIAIGSGLVSVAFGLIGSEVTVGGMLPLTFAVAVKFTVGATSRKMRQMELRQYERNES